MNPCFNIVDICFDFDSEAIEIKKVNMKFQENIVRGLREMNE